MKRLRQLHIGVRKAASLFLLCAVLLSTVQQEASAAGKVSTAPDYMAAEIFCESSAGAERAEGIRTEPQSGGKVMWLSSTSNYGQTKHFTIKRSASQRMAELLIRRTSDVRGRGHGRCFEELSIILLFTALQLYVYFCSDVRSKQCELVMKSREIVEYLRKADGKKNGLVLS